MAKIKYVCRYCGSDNVSKDAFADWDVDYQKWVLRDFYDAGYCHDCESEQKYFDEVEIKEENHDQAN